MHLRGTRIEKKVEIHATNLTNNPSPRTPMTELNEEFVKTYSAYNVFISDST
jgi:hypothetical protein